MWHEKYSCYYLPFPAPVWSYISWDVTAGQLTQEHVHKYTYSTEMIETGLMQLLISSMKKITILNFLWKDDLISIYE